MTTVDGDDAAAVQAGVARLRARLLGGRGPDASSSEIERHTRARPELAGLPAAQHLEGVARQAALARGDRAAIAADIAASREELALGVAALRELIHGRWATARRIVGCGVLAAAVVAVLRGGTSRRAR
ncbi:MAG: hypothetical protein ACR2JO_14720 [Mycobacteriales bacterium]